MNDFVAHTEIKRTRAHHMAEESSTSFRRSTSFYPWLWIEGIVEWEGNQEDTENTYNCSTAIDPSEADGNWL